MSFKITTMMRERQAGQHQHSAPNTSFMWETGLTQSILLITFVIRQ